MPIIHSFVHYSTRRYSFLSAQTHFKHFYCTHPLETIKTMLLRVSCINRLPFITISSSISRTTKARKWKIASLLKFKFLITNFGFVSNEWAKLSLNVDRDNFLLNLPTRVTRINQIVLQYYRGRVGSSERRRTFMCCKQIANWFPFLLVINHSIAHFFATLRWIFISLIFQFHHRSSSRVLIRRTFQLAIRFSFTR